MRNTFLRPLRRLLPSRLKRWLKRFWDPHQVLDLREVHAAIVPRDGALERRTLTGMPTVSVVVVTWNRLRHTQICLTTLVRSAPLAMEIIVVDNASTDGTRDWLTRNADGETLRLILNDRNRGFAAAVNQGLTAARGEIFVLLNNDTIVPHSSLVRLISHLGEDVHVVVPVTNYASEESRIDVDYSDVPGMESFAERRAAERASERRDIEVAVMYCLAMSRSTYARIGPLDEQFTIGMFEDDDYSHRAHLLGLGVACARDAFIHHFGHASFKLLDGGRFRALFRENRERFERKWQVKWRPR